MTLRSSQVPLPARNTLPRRALIALLSAAGLIAAPAAAEAQEDTQRVMEGNGEGLDLHLFRPAVDSKGFLAVNGADVLGHLDPNFGFVLDYGYRQLPLNDGHASSMMLRHAFSATFQLNLGIANMFVVGVTMPVIVNGGGEATDIGPGGAGNYSDDDLDFQGIGRIAGHVKFSILKPQGPIGIALLGQAGYTPGSGPRDFASEPGFFYWPHLILERRFIQDTFRIGLDAGYRGHTGKNPIFGKSADGVTNQLKSGVLEGSNLLTAGAAVSYRALEQLDINVEFNSTYQLGGSSDAKQKFSAEVLGGIKLFIQRNSYFTLGGGAGVTPGFQSSTIRGVIGFVFEPSIGDADGDGIKDDEDDCPNDPEDLDGFEDTKADSPAGKYGCPDPDNDQDGILDGDDACRDVAEDHDGDKDDDGCPEGGDGDRDGDGILDSRDKCPDEPEDRDGFEDKDGCPELDNDKDGIPDADDLCKNDPEDKDGFEDENGCPELDNDRDGIPDAKDQCKNDPETINGLDDEDGCPDKSNVVIEGTNVLILEKIQFKTGSAEILPESNTILNQVAGTLKGHPEFRMLEVAGHADERGDDRKNLELTQARSASVVESLVSRGIEKSRLRPMGYGEYCPLDPARNQGAWEKNRRVEFKVILTKDGPTGAEVGCATARSKGIIAPPLSRNE
jgi:outer membrane protein OmpA-like peptidoglycan-associated protein